MHPRTQSMPGITVCGDIRPWWLTRKEAATYSRRLFAPSTSQLVKGIGGLCGASKITDASP